MTTQSRYDLLIIGAGPAGLSTAIHAKQAGLSSLILDKGSIVDAIQHFQRSMFFFSTPELLSIGDIPFVVPNTRPTSADCINYYRSVADHYQLECRFYQEVVALTKESNGFVLSTADGHGYRARFVVVATGYYDTPNLLNVPGEDLPHVSHSYHDALPFFRRRVVIVGGKNSAVEAALDLWRHGAIVTVIHRGETLSSGVKYWILPDFENRVKAGSITLHLHSTVTGFEKGKTNVVIDGHPQQIETDSAFILIGYRPNVNFLRSLGIEIEADSLVPRHDPESMETNINGLFVAGGLVGGRFNNRVFIENGREHGGTIVEAIARR